MNNGRLEYTFLWLIENYSYCWHENGDFLTSPEFSFDGLEGVVWTVKLYPRGSREQYNDSISVFLKRSLTDEGPKSFSLSFELAFLKADGSTSCSRFCKFKFKRGDGYGSPSLARKDIIFLHEKDDYLPQGTITVRCKLWTGEGNIHKVSEISARTRIAIEQISFFHVTENFSSLEPNDKHTVQIRSFTRKFWILSSSLYFIDDDSNDGKIVVEIKSTNTEQILSKCNISLVDASGLKIKCGEAENIAGDTEEVTLSIPLSLTRELILDEESKYLMNDKLTLSCEYIFSTGVEYENIEKSSHEKCFVAPNQILNEVENQITQYIALKLSTCANAMEDLKEVYDNHLLTDVDVKTKTKTFPAHKILLCARSSVFKTMLTTDMKEKISNSIQVDDLEDDTVEKLLLFLYTDKLENLHWDSALKLYHAGDKYEIGKLKLKCSWFLVDNVTTASATELLILADTYNDFDLKEAVKDFILKNEKQVFGSEEWEKLTEINPQLACKTMLLKYKKKNTDST